MKVNTVDNQNFAGRAFVVGNRQRKKLTVIANELNKAKILKNAQCNIYLAYNKEFFTNNNVVKVYAKSGGFNLKKDAGEMYGNAQNTVFSLGAINSAIERAISIYNKK